MGNKAPSATPYVSAPGSTSKELDDNCPVKHRGPSADDGCPVKHGGPPADDGCPVKHDGPPRQNSEECPVKHDSKTTKYNVYSQPIDPTNNMPRLANELPSASQRSTLSTERVSSNIPKGGTQSETWTYPSPQMFYNALDRKGKLDDTKEEDIEVIVGLHNNMNEKTWAKVLEWEQTSDPGDHTPPKLSRFMGRPTDLAPKAALKHYLLGHPLPFDRHDWTILRHDGTERRYVIDYYHDDSRASEEEGSGRPALDDREAVRSILVDVRPAVDGVGELVERASMVVRNKITGGTEFKPLPLLPDKGLRGQMKESVKVWDKIQIDAAPLSEKDESFTFKRWGNSLSKTAMADDNKEVDMPTMTKEEAEDLASEIRRISAECVEAQKNLAQCNNDTECTQASAHLTLCLTGILCPIQHNAVVSSLEEKEGEDGEVHGARIEAAFGVATECVELKNDRAMVARMQFPDMFELEKP